MQPLKTLTLSTYYMWEDRKNYSLFNYPGVYAINITTDENLAGQTLNWSDIDYIGMTTVSLKRRLYGFNRAIQGKRGHSGGNTIFAEKGHRKTWDEKHIYVAMMGLQCNTEDPKPSDYRVLGTVTYLEYEAFAQYHSIMDDLPPYNKMKSKR